MSDKYILEMIIINDIIFRYGDMEVFSYNLQNKT